ncbi:MAG: hydrolase [Candidatus Magasanikbacteria bacterium]
MSNNDECCPDFIPEKWDEKIYTWDNKKFIKETIPTLFHMPFPPMIGKRMEKMMKLAKNAKALKEDMADVLVLFHDPSAFKSEIFLSVTKDVPKANNTIISGVFEGKVFDGKYNEIPKFIKEMDKYLKDKGKKAKDYYVHYAYCPGCAKKFGSNYMILFAKV